MEKNNEIKNKVVETYLGDITEVIKNDKEGLVKKIIHDEEKHELEKKIISPESTENKLFMFFSFFLVISGLLILSYFVFFKKEDNKGLIENQFTPIIFNDQITFLEVFGLKREEIKESIINQINTSKVKVGGVDGIYLTENKQNIGLRRFISLIKSNFVLTDNRIFVDDNFSMGIVNNETKNFFILIKIRSISDIFNSLHSWEGKMFSDLYEFFEFNISAENSYLLTKEFQDGIVENKNARILYDKENQIVLMYIFADYNSIVITNSQKAAHEIMMRLAASQKKQ